MQESVKERSYTEIFVPEIPKPEVRFTSGKTIYVERLAWESSTDTLH